MRFRDQVALTLPSLLLRLMLCLIFFWAGLGKVLGEMTVTGEDAARLAGMGVMMAAVKDPGVPTRALPGNDTPPRDAPTEPPVPPTGKGAENGAENNADNPSEAAPDDIASDETTGAQPVAEDMAEPPTDTELPLSSAVLPLAPRWIPVQNSAPTYTAADFPGRHRVQNLHGVSLLLSKAGRPGLGPQSRPIAQTMPAWVGAERWPVILAWAAAVTEILAAALLFFGLLTRVGALLVCGIMLMALWLTAFGPAVVGRVGSFIGFIPDFGDLWSSQQYNTLFFQLACLTMATAVFLLGSGPIGLDRALFGSHERLERTEGKAGRQRSSFDRGPTETP